MYSYPISIKLNITKDCNLRCKHCFISDYNEEIPFEVAKSLIDDFEKNKLPILFITGGEPMVYKHIMELLKYTMNKGINVNLASNGTLITKEIARNIKKFGVNSVQISVDGIEKDHDDIRGNGTFKKAINGINNLLDLDIKVILAHVINKKNIKNIDEILALAKKLNVPVIRFEIYLPISNDISNDPLLLTHTDIKKLSLFFKENKNNYPFEIELPIFKSKFGCGAGNFHCVINPNLTLSPCDLLCELISTKEKLDENNSIKSLWKDSSVFNEWRNLKIKLDANCSNCSKSGMCGYGCRAAALSYSGRLSHSDPICMTRYYGGDVK